MQWHVLACEGPDPYAQAGGIASRVEVLQHSLHVYGQSHVGSAPDRVPRYYALTSLARSSIFVGRVRNSHYRRVKNHG